MRTTRTIVSITVLLAACVLGFEVVGRPAWVVSAQEDPHAYFNALVRRSDHWKSFSLREAGQLVSRNLGGYALGSATANLSVTYDPAGDGDRHRQDAAKAVVPAFFATATLALPASSSDTVLTLIEAYKPSYPPGRVIRVDEEVMTVSKWLTDTTISVTRGTYGSAAAPHSASARLMHATNSLRNQVRLPLGTEDGHDYFFVWEGYWTDSFIGAGAFNHKAFQFSSGSRDGDAIWLEPGMQYSGGRASCWNPAVHVASFHVRSYNNPGGRAEWDAADGNKLGPGATSNSPLGPRTEYCVEANTWVRFFMHLKQRANDYDYLDMWVADERRDPVQVLFNVPLSVRPTGLTPNSISMFWLEFNSSEDELFRVDGRDLVAYVRNFVALRDVRDPRSLLVRPAAGAEPAAGPPPPIGVRILR